MSRFKRVVVGALALVVWPYICVGAVLSYAILDMHKGMPLDSRIRTTALVVTQWPRFVATTPADGGA